VASENLGAGAGLVAAAALMIDYILTAAVGISAGIEAVVSDQPWLHPHILALCLSVLAVLAMINMRGTKESAAAFMIPTAMFVGALLAAVFVGVWKVHQAGGNPMPAAPIPPAMPPTVQYLSWWLLLKAFSNGCAAMTGVEAVSNGVTAFREPRAKNAQNALTVIIATLIVLLYGTAWLATKYHIMAMDPSEHGYQSLLSLIVMAVFGRGWIYHFTMWSVFLALAFSANTAFAGFPRLARTIAMNDYLPHVFTLRGRRLLFSHGIYALTGFTFVILIMFEGSTVRLISLYAIGAFLAFTLSQAGMVMHWYREKDQKFRYGLMAINGTGAIATGITTIIVLVAKFTSGAWVTALLIPTLILLMVGVKQHYTRVREAVRMGKLNLSNLQEPLVVIPMARWDRMTEKALRFGVLLSKDLQVVNVESEEGEDRLTPIWEENVLGPIREKGLPQPQLITLHSSYRLVVSPLMDYILELEQQHPDRKITVLLPELVVNHWWENLLHNQRVQLLKLLLLLRGKQRIIVVDIPWYL